MEKNRLFTFGCSFTNFFWPTWADILGREYDFFENWGKNGAGNCFMLYSLMECIKRNAITKDDTVIIMWSSIDREDRWINGQWQLEGGVYNMAPPYSKEYVNTFADPVGFLLRDLTVIAAVKKILESIGCRWYFLAMVPLYYQDMAKIVDEKVEYPLDHKIINLFSAEISAIKPSVYEVVFNNDWYSRPGYVDLASLTTPYKNLAGADWPSMQDFVTQNFKGIANNIKNEITQKLRLDKRAIRTDTHPTPSEHLEYLEKVLPEIVVSQETKEWVTEINQQVLDLNPKYANNFRGTWHSNNPGRF